MAARGIRFEPSYVSSHDSVYLAVYRGLYLAGGGVMRTFLNAPPEVRDQLRILWTTEGYTPHAVAALPSVAPRNLEKLRQGSFFTRQGKQRVNGGGNSYGTARELMRFMLRMEQGRLVDEFSSRQIKRLLYMTERRIRYASAPALRDAAVYFKSGSLYSCREEEGFTCKPYAGNRKNYMNSVAIIESPAAERRLHYIATLVSNVLRRNSAVDHQTMGTRIQRLIEKANPAPKAEAVNPSPAP